MFSFGSETHQEDGMDWWMETCDKASTVTCRLQTVGSLRVHCKTLQLCRWLDTFIIQHWSKTLQQSWEGRRSSFVPQTASSTADIPGSPLCLRRLMGTANLGLSPVSRLLPTLMGEFPSLRRSDVTDSK